MKRISVFILTLFMVSVAMAQTTYSKELEQKAAAGDVDAQFDLGVAYGLGEGIRQDYESSLYWFTKAAEQGDAYAQNNVGGFYRDGLGVERDYEKAVYWFTKAAEQGVENAQYNLGLCYHSGNGVRVSYSKAAYWFRKAAEQGFADAQYQLGRCYDYALGEDRSLEKAVYWYTKAAEQGCAAAQNDIGACYALGDGVSQDTQKAIYWIEKAATNRFPLSLLTLGKFFSGEKIMGDIKEVDYAKSVKYLTLAKESEDNDISGQACFALAKLYRFGWGVTQDVRKANELQQEAKAKGVEKAASLEELLKDWKNSYGAMR